MCTCTTKLNRKNLRLNIQLAVYYTKNEDKLNTKKDPEIRRMQNTGKEIRVYQRKDGEQITPKAFRKRQFSITKYCITYNNNKTCE